MTALIIILAIIFSLSLISFIPITVKASYDEEFNVSLSYTFFNKSENILEIRRLIGLGIEIVSEEKTAGGIFDGEKVVLTGTLQDFKRDDAMRIIEGFGGEIMSSVSKKTTLVIAGENAGSKLEKAKSLGIKIIDEETFKMLIKT